MINALQMQWTKHLIEHKDLVQNIWKTVTLQYGLMILYEKDIQKSKNKPLLSQYAFAENQITLRAPLK